MPTVPTRGVENMEIIQVLLGKNKQEKSEEDKQF